MSSDGGLIVLRGAAIRLGLADVIAKPSPDTRDPARVLHSYADMVTARMMAIAAGYEDCDDLDCLRADPALKLACARAPQSGADLMSQPTLSRLENLAERRVLLEIGLGFIDLFCRSWTRMRPGFVLGPGASTRLCRSRARMTIPPPKPAACPARAYRWR